MPAPSLKAKAGPGRSRPHDIDRYVGARMRERRIMLGLTQQQLAELIGVTYQQTYKYEQGINRIAAGRLSGIAQALGVGVGYFFDGMDSERSFKPTLHQRMLLDLTRNFLSLRAARTRRPSAASLGRWPIPSWCQTSQWMRPPNRNSPHWSCVRIASAASSRAAAGVSRSSPASTTAAADRRQARLAKWTGEVRHAVRAPVQTSDTKAGHFNRLPLVADAACSLSD
jgi:transcriptional regulator with XRE-family HTH domain